MVVAVVVGVVVIVDVRVVVPVVVVVVVGVVRSVVVTVVVGVVNEHPMNDPSMDASIAPLKTRAVSLHAAADANSTKRKPMFATTSDALNVPRENRLTTRSSATTVSEKSALG